MLLSKGFLLVLTALCSIAISSPGNTLRIGNIAWLAGSWEGQGDDGTTTGDARSVWTEPLQGAMSWTFRWSMPEHEHVHFAFNVVQATNEGVFARGIHHGADFETFEEHPWIYRLAAAQEGRARFVCESHCGAKAVEFRLLDDGRLQETWEPLDDSQGTFVITYDRR